MDGDPDFVGFNRIAGEFNALLHPDPDTATKAFRDEIGFYQQYDP